MAKTLEPLFIGADVSKDSLAIRSGDDQATTIANTLSAVRAWLKSLPGRACIAMEATGTYHLLLATLAHARGHRVYLIDGLRLSRYRESLGGRAKTDRTDAALLRRYLQREYEGLRSWTPPPAGCAQLRRLLHRRATLVKMQCGLSQSFADIPELRAHTRGLLDRIKAVLKAMDEKLQAVAKTAELLEPAHRLREIEGIGPLTSIAVATSHRLGAFRSADSFIAFHGLDVRVRESGNHRGRRKLTKQGDPEIRRLLHNAAMAASRRGRWKLLYEAYQARGLTKTEALVILARKLLRIAFALLQTGQTYDPNKVGDPCMST